LHIIIFFVIQIIHLIIRYLLVYTLISLLIKSLVVNMGDHIKVEVVNAEKNFRVESVSYEHIL